MTKRVFNFNPGPAVLPLEVLEQAQAELLDFKGTGMSVMEISHRSKEFEAVIQTAEADLRELLGIPANYKVMFLQGGASLQFAMLPMNLRAAGASADYIVTGTWSKTAIKEAKKLGAARAAANTEAEGFKRLPASLDLDPNAAYLHFTSNETIHGVEFFEEPTPPAGVPLICDTSSDFISRPIDVSKYALLYAGAQKNAGPAGVTVVIARDDMLERTPANLPVMLDYKALAASGSLHNTPPALPSTWSDWSSSGPRSWAACQRSRRSTEESRPDLQGHRRERRLLPRPCRARSPLGHEHPLPPALRRARGYVRQGSQEERPDRPQGTPLGRRHARLHLQRHARGRRRGTGQVHEGIPEEERIIG